MWKIIHRSILEKYFSESVIVPEPNLTEKITMLKEHLSLEIEFMGEKNGIKFMRKFYGYYINSKRNASKYRNVLVTLEDRKEIEKTIDEILSLHFADGE